jgi:CheY-like chemotaxis protein
MPFDPTAAPLVVLIVEDDELSRDVMVEYLALGGFSAHGSADGPSALAALSTFQPRVVIADLGLPGMSGVELARAIRAQPDPSLAGVKLMALTGSADPAVIEGCTAAGFDLVRTKPLSLKELPVLIRRLAAEIA